MTRSIKPQHNCSDRWCGCRGSGWDWPGPLVLETFCCQLLSHKLTEWATSPCRADFRADMVFRPPCFHFYQYLGHFRGTRHVLSGATDRRFIRLEIIRPL